MSRHNYFGFLNKGHSERKFEHTKNLNNISGMSKDNSHWELEEIDEFQKEGAMIVSKTVIK